MTTPEDRLRAALNAAAATVPPGSAPPLRLPPRRARAGRWLRYPRWRGWLGPLAAAAATALVVTLTETVPFPGGNGTPAARAAGVPPYYVVLTYGNPALGPPGDAMVRSTATGRLISAVTAPGHARFTAVTAAGGSAGTFVLAARLPSPPGRARVGALRFFSLTAGPSARAVRLRELPVHVTPAAAVLTGLALTPDASKLAISLVIGYVSEIRVVWLATGRSRAWSGQTPGARSLGPGVNWVMGLSWAGDDRTLAYDNLYNVRMLDTAAPGRRLALDAASGPGRPASSPSGVRVTMSCQANAGGEYGNAMLARDGSLIVASGGYRGGKAVAAVIPRRLWHPGGLTFPCSGRGRQVLRSDLRNARYGRLTGAVRWIYWAAPDGRSLIVVANFGLGGRGLVGVLRGTRFTPLPGSGQIPVAPAPPDAPAAW